MYIICLYQNRRINKIQSPKESLSLPNCQTSGSLTLVTTSFSKRDLRSLNSFSSSHASMVAVWEFAKSFANLLRSGSALEHVNRVERCTTHSKAASSTHQDKQVLSMDKTPAKKNLPKLETMDGRFPFFLVTLHKVIYFDALFLLFLLLKKVNLWKIPNPEIWSILWGRLGWIVLLSIASVLIQYNPWWHTVQSNAPDVGMIPFESFWSFGGISTTLSCMLL